MARRSRKADSAAIGLVVIVIVISLLGKFFQAVGYAFPALLVGGGLGVYFWNKAYQRKKRLLYLSDKYDDPEVVEKIMNRIIWEGQTAEQLQDTLGAPVAVDDKVVKTKKKEIWKYGHQGTNRYRTRITLENDEVVGWENRS